jgi:hypothetical protein
VYVFLTLKIGLAACGGETTRIARITATDLRFELGPIDFSCRIEFLGLGVWTRNLEGDIRGPITAAVNSQLRNILMNLISDNFSQIQLPVISCVRVPACVPGVIPGDDAGLYRPAALDGLTFPRCQDLCRDTPGCEMMFQQFGQASDRAGRCVMYGKDALSAPVIQIPGPGGDIWIKSTDRILRQSAPYPTVPVLGFPGTTHVFSLAECEERARAYGLPAWGYGPRGCHLYKEPYEYQKMSLDLSRCGKNLQKPNEFA